LALLPFFGFVLSLIRNEYCFKMKVKAGQIEIEGDLAKGQPFLLSRN
jgi:hypothetical protein